MVIERNSKVPTLVLTTNDGLTSSWITSTCKTKVIIGKGMILKHVPPLIKLTTLVTITCSFDQVER
jgi:hypothetical protein